MPAGTAPADPVARESALHGWVYASLQVDKLLGEAMATTEGLLSVELYDGGTAFPGAVLFDSDAKLEFDDAQWGGDVRSLRAAALYFTGFFAFTAQVTSVIPAMDLVPTVATKDVFDAGCVPKMKFTPRSTVSLSNRSGYAFMRW